MVDYEYEVFLSQDTTINKWLEGSFFISDLYHKVYEIPSGGMYYKRIEYELDIVKPSKIIETLV